MQSTREGCLDPHELPVSLYLALELFVIRVSHDPLGGFYAYHCIYYAYLTTPRDPRGILRVSLYLALEFFVTRVSHEPSGSLGDSTHFRMML